MKILQSLAIPVALAVSLALGGCGSSGAAGTNGTSGVNGVNGTNGANGNGGLNVFGDGSAGALSVAGGQRVDLSAAGNLSFTNITIASGGVLTLGTDQIVHCTETFTNNGLVVAVNNTSQIQGIAGNGGTPGFPSVFSQVAGAGLFFPGGEGIDTATGGTVTGVAPGAAQLNALFNLVTLPGNILQQGQQLGGGGASSEGGALSSNAGNSGGSLTILVAGAFINGPTGTINVSGQPGFSGAGGGSGGILVICSDTSIANTGLVSAAGGNGGDNNESSGPGGGGGGGLIHLHCAAGPASITGFGGAGVSVIPGTPGSPNALAITPAGDVCGGGAGGSCAGVGGNGGTVESNGTVDAGTAGTAGAVVIDSNATPTSTVVLF